VLHAQDHAENIRVERLGIAFRALVRDRANLALGASIVHRDIETAKLCDGLVEQSANVILLADVGADEFGLRTQRTQLFNERLASLITPTGNDDIAPFLAKATAAERPMPVRAPVIKTTCMFIALLLMTD
jgi:hypothetical protein